MSMPDVEPGDELSVVFDLYGDAKVVVRRNGKEQHAEESYDIWYAREKWTSLLAAACLGVPPGFAHLLPREHIIDFVRAAMIAVGDPVVSRDAEDVRFYGRHAIIRQWATRQLGNAGLGSNAHPRQLAQTLWKGVTGEDCDPVPVPLSVDGWVVEEPSVDRSSRPSAQASVVARLAEMEEAKRVLSRKAQCSACGLHVTSYEVTVQWTPSSTYTFGCCDSCLQSVATRLRVGHPKCQAPSTSVTSDDSAAIIEKLQRLHGVRVQASHRPTKLRSPIESPWSGMDAGMKPRITVDGRPADWSACESCLRALLNGLKIEPEVSSAHHDMTYAEERRALEESERARAEDAAARAEAVHWATDMQGMLAKARKGLCTQRRECSNAATQCGIAAVTGVPLPILLACDECLNWYGQLPFAPLESLPTVEEMLGPPHHHWTGTNLRSLQRASLERLADVGVRMYTDGALPDDLLLMYVPATVLALEPDIFRGACVSARNFVGLYVPAEVAELPSGASAIERACRACRNAVAQEILEKTSKGIRIPMRHGHMRVFMNPNHRVASMLPLDSAWSSLPDLSAYEQYHVFGANGHTLGWRRWEHRDSRILVADGYLAMSMLGSAIIY